MPGPHVVGLGEPDYQRDSEEAVCEWESNATPPHSKQSATERGAELLASEAKPSNEGTLAIARKGKRPGRRVGSRGRSPIWGSCPDDAGLMSRGSEEPI